MKTKAQAKTKHVPIRTCIATGEKHAKNELLRLVATPDGEIVVDVKGKTKGRGANILPTQEALELALKKKAIVRALKLEKGLDVSQIDKLRKDFAEAIAERAFRKGNRKVVIKVSKEKLTPVA